MKTAADHLMQIVSDQGGTLVVQQGPTEASSSILRYILGFAMLLLGAYLVKSHRWKLLAILVLGLIALAATSKPDQSVELSLNRTAGLLSWKTLSNGKEVSSTEVALRDLSTANVQTSMQGARLLLVRRDGGTAYPFNERFLNNEPSQYTVAHEIQQTIDQTADGTGATPESVPLTPQGDQGSHGR